MGIPHHPATSKKSANLSVSSELLRQARALNINLSQALEQRLAEIVRESRQRDWLEKNRESLDDYNRRIKKRGAYSDGLRRF
ncbi:MAG: type II toxin-antitoxin system CcdA family antitoxin [Pseudomonadota bacterium]|jgi:antitoxin CcdA